MFKSSSRKVMETARNVDLKRYAGRWYEIASMPTRFQPKSGTNTRATYTLNEDSTIHVLNETWLAGKRSSIEGQAWKADASSDEAKLLVKFWVPPFLPVIPVTGDYWVLDLEKEEYNYALVGQPSLKSLWILSRTPELSEEAYNRLTEKAASVGYDISKLQKTAHPEELSRTTLPKTRRAGGFESKCGKITFSGKIVDAIQVGAR